MFQAILKLFLWWWPALPGWLRYSLSGLVVVGAIVGWIMTPPAWPAFMVLIFVGLSMMVYGDPSEAEKRGYRD